MKSTTTVKKNYEFRRMYAKGKSGVSSCLVVYYRKNQLGHNRLGVTVSTNGDVTGDYPGFASNTGIIELVRQNERFSFIINNSRAKEQRLRIEASLLNLAMEVY